MVQTRGSAGRGNKPRRKKTAARKSASKGGRASKKKRSGGKRPAQAGGKRLPARSSSAHDAKRGEVAVRLNKYLADHGVASRRACDELIASGKVMVDGEPVTALGSKVDPSVQRVEVDGYVLKPEDTGASLLPLAQAGGRGVHQRRARNASTCDRLDHRSWPRARVHGRSFG